MMYRLLLLLLPLLFVVSSDVVGAFYHLTGADVIHNYLLEIIPIISLYSSTLQAALEIPLEHINTHTHPFNGPLFRTTRVSRYQNGKTNLDFTEARDSEWQWHQLVHMQVCTSLQTDNHASTPPLGFYRPGALAAAQPIASKGSRHARFR